MTEKILAIMFVKTIWEGYEINTDLLTLLKYGWSFYFKEL